jgi:predicted alpha/beta-fold hydrolase
MPSATSDFEPLPLLANAHLMTIAAALWRRTFSLPPSEERLFAVDAESRILGHCNWQEGKQRQTPVMVIVHGLEGSSDSNYMKGIAEKAWAKGFHVVRLNQRNCGGTELLTPTLYNSGMSGDYRSVFEELAHVDGFEQIFFAGYSMGGNLVTKMAGEFGANAPRQLRAVCSVCPALDLAACADELERWDNFFYQERFVRGLMKRYEHKAELFPQLYPKNGFGSIRTVREFDDAITAPAFGFKNAAEYYESAGAKRVVGEICVPYLLITSQDDPFVPYEAILAAGVEKNPAIRLDAPKHGGHCGFVSRHAGERRFWAEEKIVAFCCEQLSK